MQGIRPYVEGGTVRGDIEISVGADTHYQNFGLALSDDRFSVANTGWTLGLWTELEWQLGDFLINPSIRLDHYSYTLPSGSVLGKSTLSETAVDPRISVAYELNKGFRVKSSLAIHSGPARFSFAEPPVVFGPIPAFEGLGLQYGLQRTKQVQLGIESKIPGDLEFNLTGFYNDNDIPVDFSLLNKNLQADPTACDRGPQQEFTCPLTSKGGVLEPRCFCGGVWGNRFSVGPPTPSPAPSETSRLDSWRSLSLQHRTSMHPFDRRSL